MPDEQVYNIYVSLLGKFSVQLLDGANNDIRSSSTHLRQHSFLQYLCVFHDRAVSQKELIEAIWDDETDTGDPAKTLKTTLYRTRRLLEDIGIENAKDILIYRRGFYSWAPQAHITLDVEVFDRLYDQFYASPQPYKTLDCALEALALFKGDFLAGDSGNLWALSMRTYYHSKYIKLARDAAGALYQEGRLEEGIALCRSATTADPYDEETQLLMMKLLHAAGLTQSAIKHYEEVRSLFMDQLGVTLSQELSDFYRKLTRSDEPRELDLQVIRSRLLEDAPAAGAYFCEYSVFQNVYRLVARSIMRTGQATHLAMVVLCGANGEALTVKRCTETMDSLHDAISCTLRIGDVFTRFSRDQYLIMLPSSSYENAAMVLERVIAAYQRTLSGMTTRIKYSILPVLPPKSDQIKAHTESTGNIWESRAGRLKNKL